MENRVTRLEAEFTYVRRDLDEIKAKMEDIGARLAAIDTQLANKPGKGFVIGTVIAIFGLCAGMVGATVAAMQYLQGHV